MKTALEEPLRLMLSGIENTPLRLEDLVDRDALHDMVVSAEHMFALKVRVVALSGLLLAGPPLPEPPHGGVEMPRDGRRTQPLDRSGIRATRGDHLRVVPISYDQRLLGQLVLGPFLVDDWDTAEESSTPPEVPRFSSSKVEAISRHLATVIELMLFSGHKALLTSQMHIASTQESYRELCEKNQRLEEAYERLKELDRLKSNFLATISHELRTPLTSIIGYGEMLAEGVAGPLNEEQREFLGTIQAKSQELLGLIMSLLDLSKLESGTMPVRVAEVQLRMVIADAVATIVPSAVKKGVGVDYAIEESLPRVLGDRDRLRQVFVNLIENAVKFTPRDGSIRISVRQTAETLVDEPGIILVAPLRPAVEIRVADTGIGIPAEERQRVFDPFYQVDQSSTREHRGAGLGLAIVKRLVDAHHGTIHTEPNEPCGTVFVVTLPAARLSSTPPAARIYLGEE